MALYQNCECQLQPEFKNLRVTVVYAAEILFQN